MSDSKRYGKENYIIRKILLIVIIACLYLMIVPDGVCNPERAEAETVPESYRYAYQNLTDEDIKYAYTLLVDGVGNADETINISSTDQSITIEDFQVAAEAVHSDYPEYFWWNGAYSQYSSSGNVTKILPEYYMTGDALTNARNSFEEKVDEILEKIDAEMSDYEKTKYLHDELANIVTYESVGYHQTSYGALVNGKAVCAGYARAYQHLLHKSGLTAWAVPGESINPATDEAEPHLWNLVIIGGKCYYTDVTWDDQGNTIFHEYLNTTKEIMDETHFIDGDIANGLYPDCLPAECNHTGMRYFDVEENTLSVTDAVTAKELAAYFGPFVSDGEKMSRTVNLLYEGDDFSSWLNGISGELLRELGYTGSVSISRVSLDKEYFLTVTGTPTSSIITGTVVCKITSYNLKNEITIQLMQNSVVKKTYTVSAGTESGKYIQTITLPQVETGQYDLVISKKGHLSYTITDVTVSEGEIEVSAELLTGDINGDDWINFSDLQVLRNNKNYGKETSDTGVETIADLNGDGWVNFSDLQILRNNANYGKSAVIVSYNA